MPRLFTILRGPTEEKSILEQFGVRKAQKTRSWPYQRSSAGRFWPTEPRWVPERGKTGVREGKSPFFSTFRGPRAVWGQKRPNSRSGPNQRSSAGSFRPTRSRMSSERGNLPFFPTFHDSEVRNAQKSRSGPYQRSSAGSFRPTRSPVGPREREISLLRAVFEVREQFGVPNGRNSRSGPYECSSAGRFWPTRSGGHPRPVWRAEIEVRGPFGGQKRPKIEIGT